MSYVYIESVHGELWTVGFYKPDGKWVAESDHNSASDAAERVHYLNGGVAEPVNVKAVCESVAQPTATSAPVPQLAISRELSNRLWEKYAGD